MELIWWVWFLEFPLYGTDMVDLVPGISAIWNSYGGLVPGIPLNGTDMVELVPGISI